MTSDARVLFVSHASTVSGAELVLLDLVGACRHPAAFVFEAGDLPARLEAQGVAVEVQKGDGGRLRDVKRDGSLIKSIPTAGRLAKITAALIARARDHDVFYANSQKAFTLSAIAAAISRRPLIWHLHDILSPAHFGRRQRQMQVFLANRFATAVIVPSRAVSDAFIAEGGRSDLVRIVPNGLSIDTDQRPREQLRRDLGLPAGQLVGVFSRLAPWKGQHVAIEALARVPGANLIIVGSPLFGEVQYEAKLRALTEELGLKDRVTFLGQRSDVGRLMQAVDLVVHPSVDPEPFGRTLVEAMLARTPVVATDAGAAAEILSSGEAGILVPPGDTQALAEAALQALTGGPSIGTRVQNAETRALRDYSVPVMQDRIAGIIDDAVRTGGS